MADKSTDWHEGYSAGYAAALLQAAKIGHGHRAISLNAGHIVAGIAAGSVGDFIIQHAREMGLWDESNPSPLIKSNNELLAEASPTT